MSQLVIARLSDTHIGLETERPYGINVRAHFESIVEDMKSKEFDLIVITGDLAFRNDFKLPYRWIKEQLKTFKKPVYCIAGNHDNAPLLAKTFELKRHLKKKRLYYKVDVKGYPLIFLDSSSNRVSFSQLKWLDKESKKLKDEALLFMHHPPTYADSLYMDRKYPLKNIKKTMKRLKECSNINNIICGHYHLDRSFEAEGKEIHIGPSTWFQIDPNHSQFKIGNPAPGWQLLTWDGKNLQTESRFI